MDSHRPIAWRALLATATVALPAARAGGGLWRVQRALPELRVRPRRRRLAQWSRAQPDAGARCACDGASLQLDRVATATLCRGCGRALAGGASGRLPARRQRVA